MPNGKKYCFYESPNIVIVPTVSFPNGPPEKKIRLDNDSKTAATTSNIKTFKNNNSWASNYLQSIGQSPLQLATASKSKIPVVCYPDRGAYYEVIQENPAIKNYWTEKRKPEPKTDINNFPERSLPLESKGKQNNITVIQHNPPKPTTQLDSNLGSNKIHSMLKKYDSKIQDKQSLVAKNQMKEADHNKLTSKLPLSEPKKPILPSSNTCNEKDRKTQMQKQKKILNTPCFKSKLNYKNENCYKVNKVTKIKKCDSEIQDKQSLVAKNQIKGAGHNKLTSKLPLSEPKKPIVPLSKTYNEKDGKNQMQKQKKILDTACFESKLNNKNENCYKVNKVAKIKKCDSEIQDKQSPVAKNLIKEAGHNKLTSKLPLSEPKKPIVPPSKTYNEKDGKIQMQKQKKILDTPCFKSKLNNQNENCYKVNKVTEQHISRHNSNQKLGNEVHYKKIKFKAPCAFSTPGAQEVTNNLSKKEKCSEIKNQDINKIDNRVKSLLSSIFPVEKIEKTAGTQLCLHKSKSKTKNKITNMKVQTTEYISDSFSSAENIKCVDKIEKNVVSPYESGKAKNSGNQTLKKKSLTKAYTVTQSSKYKCEKQKYKSKFNKNSKVAKNAPLVKVHNKHNQLKHTSKEVCHIKEKCHENSKCSPPATEVINPTSADHTNTGKIIMKNSVKSVVQLPDNFKFKVPSKDCIRSPLVVEDLRRKLNRAKKYRDNLIVSVPSDVTFDRDNKVKQELSTQNKSGKTKVTTIKLVINLISGKTKEKSIEEEPKINESCELASLDLSFLDDFNVDDIVDSLNYDVNICKHIEEETKNGETYEACGPNSLNENGPVMDIIPGSMCENNEPDKTQHKHEIGIKTEHSQRDEESMTEMIITSKKQLTCNTSRKKDFNAYIESRIAGKNLTMIDRRNLLKPSGSNHRTIETNLKKCFSENSTGKNHIFIATEENIKETSSQSDFKDLAGHVQQTGVNMQSQNANTTDKSSVDSLLNLCMDTCKKSDDKSKGTIVLTEPNQKTVPNMQSKNANTTDKSSVDSLLNLCMDTCKKSDDKSKGTIDLTEPNQKTVLNMQQVKNNITNESSTDDTSIDLTEPVEKTNPKMQQLNTNITYKSFTDAIDLTEPEENTNSKRQQLNANITNESSADILKLLLNTMIDPSKTSDDRSNGAIDLTKPEQKTVLNKLEVNNNITNNSSTGYNIFIDLTEPERNTNPKVQQLNTNVKDNISADILLDSFKSKTDNSKSSHNITYIDLTEPEQIFCSNMQLQNTNIKGVSSADIAIKSSTSTKDTYKSSDNIRDINSSGPEQNVVPITQHLADLNTRISVENCVSNDSLQTSASNVELAKTTSINVATENEIDPKNLNKCNEKVENECNFKMTKQNEESKENTCPAKIRSEPICQNSPKVSQVNTTQVTSLQVNSDKTNKNDIHDQPKATDATYVKGQGSPDIVKHSPQASKQLLEKVDSVKTTAGLRKTSCEEILSRDLESRMSDYLGINYHIGALIRKGKYSKIFHCIGPNKNEYAIKVLHEQQNRHELGIKKENMLLNMQKDIPKENLHFVFFINGFGIEGRGRWCFLMEYYPKNLRHVLNENKECFYNIDEVQNLSRQLVKAVIVLRHNNIVHSDIKPEHILLNNSLDRLKLCGFDECRSVDQVILLPNIGTSSYRAPEIILGYSDGFSIDVWSTALVMFEMATGRKLFPGVYNNDILFKQMSVFGNIPLQMIHSSIFKNSHFSGHYTYTYFMRRTGYKGKEVEFIGNFHRYGITSHIFIAYQKVFQNTATRDKVKDQQKISLFCDLLHEMFVMDPKQRIPIEFVYANPFIYE